MGLGALEIGQTHALMKIGPLLLEAVEVTMRQRDPLARHLQRQIEYQRQVGLTVAMHPVLERLQLVAVQTAAPP